MKFSFTVILFFTSIFGYSQKWTLKNQNRTQIYKELGYKSKKKFLKDYNAFSETIKKETAPKGWDKVCYKKHKKDMCDVSLKYLASRERKSSKKRSRKKSKKKARIKLKNASLLAKEDYKSLLRRFPNKKASDLIKYANRSLKRTHCPRNLSLVAAYELEKHIQKGKHTKLITKLYDHGTACKIDKKPWAEFVHFHYGTILYRNKKYSSAAESFKKALNVSITRENASTLYWLYKTHTKLKSQKTALSFGNQLVEKYPRSWYTIQFTKAEKIPFVDNIFNKPAVNEKYLLSGKHSFNKYMSWLKALLLLESDKYRLENFAQYVVFQYPYSHKDHGSVLHLSRLLNQASLYRLSIYSAAQLNYRKPEVLNEAMLKLIFPLPYFVAIKKHSLKQNLDPTVILSLIKQESAFNEKARSHANAKGLMQLLSRTARGIDRKKYKRLYDFNTNIELGTKHFSKVLAKFDGSFEKSLSAYNAGIRRVNIWEEHLSEIDDVELYLSSIPYKETRSYATSILRNAFWYYQLYPENLRFLKKNVRTARLLKPHIEEFLSNVQLRQPSRSDSLKIQKK